MAMFTQRMRPLNHEDTAGSLREIESFLMRMQEELEYVLTHLDSDNVIALDFDITEVKGGNR